MGFAREGGIGDICTCMAARRGFVRPGCRVRFPAREIGVLMLRACPYCGRIHSKDYDCGRKPVYGSKDRSAIDMFRGTPAWKRKRAAVRERDGNLCRVCLAQSRLVYDDLSVHHIIPIDKGWDMRIDDDNLITLCPHCHEEAEKGNIPADWLRRLAGIPPAIYGKKSEAGTTDAGGRETKDSQNAK